MFIEKVNAISHKLDERRLKLCENIKCGMLGRKMESQFETERRVTNPSPPKVWTLMADVCDMYSDLPSTS